MGKRREDQAEEEKVIVGARHYVAPIYAKNVNHLLGDLAVAKLEVGFKEMAVKAEKAKLLVLKEERLKIAMEAIWFEFGGSDEEFDAFYPELRLRVLFDGTVSEYCKRKAEGKISW